VILPADVRALFEGANFVALATLLPSGAPVSIPIWAGVEGGRIVFFTQPQSRKAQAIERDPRVALSVIDHENPYRSARVRGHVAETIDGDEALAIIDRLAHKYTGQPFPLRTGRVYVIECARASFAELPFTHAPPG
jgi:PPOX class probable F420-dependent enzyme